MLRAGFLKMPSKSQIKIKLTNRVKHLNLFFYFILHNKVSWRGGVRGRYRPNVYIQKVGRYRKNIREKNGRVYLVE